MKKKINRKSFFKGIALGTISLPFLIRACGGKNVAQNITAPNILSAKKYRWKMVTTWPPNFPVLGEGCTLFAQWVNEMSDGRLAIEVYGSGELVPGLQAFDTVSSGGADIGSGAAYYWAGKTPAAQFFASVPFGMNAQQLNAWILCGGGMQLWEELYADYNLVPMLGGNTGVQMGGWFNREINSLADLKGLKMRIPGLGGKVLNKAGGTAVLSAGSEIYTNLERGVIDATEWIGPYHDYVMGFHNIADYYYSPGWHEVGTALEFFINKKRYDALPKDLQVILQTAAARLNVWMLSEFETKNSIYLRKLVEEENVAVRFYPPEVLTQLRSFTEEIITEITDKDPMSKKIYDSYQKFRRGAVKWSELTEKVFYNNLQI
ncbi:MAG: TRAP transporter substrate-binding protein [Saprospiraceae bacterium]